MAWCASTHPSCHRSLTFLQFYNWWITLSVLSRIFFCAEPPLIIMSSQQLHQRCGPPPVLQYPPPYPAVLRYHGRHTSYCTLQTPAIRQHTAITTPPLRLSHHFYFSHLAQPVGSRSLPPPHWLRCRRPRPYVRPLRPGSRRCRFSFLPSTPSSSSWARQTSPGHHRALRLIPHPKTLGRL